MKTYSRHNCTRTHRDPRTYARCTWPHAHWITGNGAYATVSRCRGTTVHLWPTPDAAHEAHASLDVGRCGGACTRQHEVIALGPFLPAARAAA